MSMIMAERAPGLDQLRNDTGCFNCGSLDHFAYACPEPTRKEPHGAGVVRQRQAAKGMHGSGGKGSDASRSKGGLVVTRYGPPPVQYPPPPTPASNAWGAAPPGPVFPPPSLPPNPYTQQHPPGYPPSSKAPVAFPLSQPPPPPPPYPYLTTPFVPPTPPAPGLGPYPHGPPPPSSYGPPEPYVSGTYPSAYQPSSALFPGAPPASFQGPPPTYAPPPGYSSSVPPGPPPPPGLLPPAPYSSTTARYEGTYSAPKTQSWQSESNGHVHSRHRDQRERRKDRDKGGKNKHQRRSNDSHQRGRGHRHEGSAQRSMTNSRQQTPKSTSVTKDNSPAIPNAEQTKPSKTESETDPDNPEDDFQWYLKKAFVDLETKPADPVGKPLAPEWNDEPTIPPAYDAKCIKSAFYDPDNPDALLASVRDTNHWPDMKRDPIFRYRRGMVAVRFQGSVHEYYTYKCSRRIGSEWFRDREIVPVPTDATLNDAMKPRASHLHDRSPSQLSNGKRSHNDVSEYGREAKRFRTSTGRIRSPPPSLPRRPSSRHTDMDGGSWAPPVSYNRGDSPSKSYAKESSHSPSGYRLVNGDIVRQDHSTSYSSAQRHDSGYHSAHSADKLKSRRDQDERSYGHNMPPAIHDRDHDRDINREGARDRTRHQGHGRGRNERSLSPPLAKIRSRTRSPAPVDDESDTESGLSDLEYELLGMKKPEKKRVPPPKPMVKKQRPRLNDAFSRRW